MKTFEEQKALVGQLNLMDDLFFHKVAEDIKACEEILRIILQKPDLTVKDCQPQRFLRNVDAHSVILDVLCTDESGRLFNIEVQKQDDDAHQRRVRFNISNIDTTFMEKGLHYKDFPEVCVVFISKFDMFQKNRTLYHVRRIVEETNDFVENGTHEIYVNTAINDGSAIAELMQYFVNSNGYYENFKAVCNRVTYLKEANEGVNSMSSVIEQYAKQYHEEKMRNSSVIEQYAQEYYEERMLEERAKQKQANAKKTKETIIRLLKAGVSEEVIAQAIPSVSLETIQELKHTLETR